MKITKSMYYHKTEESRELLLYACGSNDLQTRRIIPVIKCLSKYYKRGTFDREKAICAFYSVATDASKRYWYEFGGCYSWKNCFTVTDRCTAATDLLDFFMEDIESGQI